MKELDVYYRALLGYKKQVAESDRCAALISAIADSSVEGDKITVRTATCTIDEDWVSAIEEGLVHIEKAIKMERQFIRSNGEVIPIEKVKHVSKESVEHLAKHSNLITRYEEGEDIVPDKLFTVERLNDYAVYENRFLYMLLCYLRDFVTLRYNEILDLTNKYDATVVFDKRITNGKESMTYQLSMHDVRRDDDYLKNHNPAKAIIDRIDLILKTILAFLATPLMEEAGKAPMLKPPITKTNVLKMNNSFKGAVALYDFIVSYDKKGYNVQPIEKSISPLREELALDMAGAGGMLAFLAYEWGLGIRPELRAEYQREEERRAEEQIRQRAERIASMKRRLKSADVSIEDYVITLEKQLRALEGEAERAASLSKEVDRLRSVEREHLAKIDELGKENGTLREELINERQRHFEEMEALKRAHEDAMHDLVVKHENEITELKSAHAEAIARLEAEHAEQIEELNTRHRERIEALETAHKERIAEITEDAAGRIAAMKESTDARIGEMQNVLDTANAELERVRADYATTLEAKRVAEARLKAAIGVDRDLTDKESFTELEKEFEAFSAIFKEQWAKTKRQIRKKHLNLQNIKGQAEQKKDSE